MRGLIYRSQGCLVSPTSTVNTVILNLHPAKGSKLRNNYACLLRRGRRTPKGCMENILYGFEPRYTPPTRFPSRQIILRFEGGGAGRREREREKGEEKVSLATIRSSSNIRKLGRIDRSFDKRQRIIGWWKLVLLSPSGNLAYFSREQRLDVFTPADFSLRRARRRFVCEYEMRETCSYGRTLSRKALARKGEETEKRGRRSTPPVPFNLRGNIFGLNSLAELGVL